MSIYAAGKYLMKDYRQPIYIGDRKVKSIYVEHTLVYPESLPEEELHPTYSMWVNLNDEICTTYGNVPLDKAGLIVYAPEGMEIKTCAALIFPKFMKFEDKRGDASLCDVMCLFAECENPKFLRIGAFGMYRGKCVYHYIVDSTQVLIAYAHVKKGAVTFDNVKNGVASTRLFGYCVFLKNGNGVSFASGVESDGIKIAYPSSYTDKDAPEK